MKSYGRAPTFLLLTGYEQVRSVVCALVGDEAGASAVELVLPRRASARRIAARAAQIPAAACQRAHPRSRW